GAGVEANHKVVYLTESVPPVDLEAGLAARGAGTEQARLGQVEVLLARDAYLIDGRFDPMATVRVLAAMARQATADGYRGLRVVADMAWALSRPPGVEDLPGFEAQANAVCLNGEALAVCLYDRRAF